MPKTCVIIPCYNEETRLPVKEFTAFALTNQDIHFLFVNDGSTDNTQVVLENIVKAGVNLHCLELTKNGGKAEAVRQGILWAIQNTDAGYIGFWDADLATPLSELTVFMQLITDRDLDVVTGLRLLRLGANVKRKKFRHYVGRVFATLVSAILDISVYDTQCGAKLFKASVASSLFKEAFITRWLFDVEVLARYIQTYGKERTTKKIYEYPVMNWEDIGGSRLKLGDFLKAPVELLKIYRSYKTN